VSKKGKEKISMEHYVQVQIVAYVTTNHRTTENHFLWSSGPQQPWNSNLS